MSDDQAHLMLSHSGLRGIVGQSLTESVAVRYGACLGRALSAAAGERSAAGTPATVVVGRDSRPSGSWLEPAVVAGLVGAGCQVVRLGIVTTPAVGARVRHSDAAGGAIVTASHNPGQWNGIKMITARGTAPTPSEAAAVIDDFQLDPASPSTASAEGAVSDDPTAGDAHVARVLKEVDVDRIAARGFHAVIDSTHGAGGPSTARLASNVGVRTTHLFAEPTGDFPHDPEPTRDNLRTLSAAVEAQGADIGFAQDPDADRLAIVDERGQYIGEEFTLALCCRHALARRAAGGAPPVLAANLSTSRMIDDAAAEHGATVVRTAVGEANVAGAMLQHDALIGGEGNGGVIWPPVAMVRDSLMSIALVLEMLAASGGRLSEIVAAVPSYDIVKEKVPIAPQRGAISADLLAPHFDDALTVSDVDGLRFDWSDRWVHVRPSNTEPVVRIIAEAAHASDAQALVDTVRQRLDADTG